MRNSLKFVGNDTFDMVLCHFYREIVLSLALIATCVVLLRNAFWRKKRTRTNRTRSPALTGWKRRADRTRVRSVRPLTRVSRLITKIRRILSRHVNKGLTRVKKGKDVRDIRRRGSFPQDAHCGRTGWRALGHFFCWFLPSGPSRSGGDFGGVPVIDI